MRNKDQGVGARKAKLDGEVVGGKDTSRPALTKLSMRPKISRTVATTSKQSSSCSSTPPPAPAVLVVPDVISLRTSRTSSCTLSRPAPPLPPSRLRVPPPMATGPATLDVVCPNGHVLNSAKMSSHLAKAASRESYERRCRAFSNTLDAYAAVSFDVCKRLTGADQSDCSHMPVPDLLLLQRLRRDSCGPRRQQRQRPLHHILLCVHICYWMGRHVEQ